MSDAGFDNVVYIQEWRKRPKREPEPTLPPPTPEQESAAASDTPTTEELQYTASRGIDVLAVTSPVAYDALREVSHEWVRDCLHEDPALEEDALRLAYWFKNELWRVEEEYKHPGVFTTGIDAIKNPFDQQEYLENLRLWEVHRNTPVPPTILLARKIIGESRMSLRRLLGLGTKIAWERSQDPEPAPGGTPERPPTIDPRPAEHLRRIRAPLSRMVTQMVWYRNPFTSWAPKRYRKLLDARYAQRMTPELGAAAEARILTHARRLSPAIAEFRERDVLRFVFAAVGEMYNQLQLEAFRIQENVRRGIIDVPSIPQKPEQR